MIYVYYYISYLVCKCIYIYIYIPYYIITILETELKGQAASKTYAWRLTLMFVLDICVLTVSFHNFKSQNFKLSVSNPKSKYVAYVSVLSRISNSQGLGRKNKLEILKTYRKIPGSRFRTKAYQHRSLGDRKRGDEKRGDRKIKFVCVCLLCISVYLSYPPLSVLPSSQHLQDHPITNLRFAQTLDKTCIYIYIYVYVCMYVCIYIYIYIHMSN